MQNYLVSFWIHVSQQSFMPKIAAGLILMLGKLVHVVQNKDRIACYAILSMQES